MKGLRDEVARFADAMEGKLRANDHRKGERGWRRMQIWLLLRRLKHEVAELEDAVRSGKVDAIESEAADVGNFAMMISDRVRVSGAE